MLKKFSVGIEKKYIVAAILIVLPLVLLEIWSVNRLATLGTEINQLESTASSLTLENQELQVQVAQRSSLTQIESTSQLLGFAKIKNIQAVEPNGLALNQVK